MPRHRMPARREWRSLIAASTAAATLAMGVTALTSSVHADVSTISQDTLRTGWDRNEPALSPASVVSSDFGQQFSTPVDGQVYASPLVVNNMLVTATENNKVYGMDPATGAIAWTRDLGPAWPITKVWNTCTDLYPNIGVTSTPVFDPTSGYVYLTSKVNDGADVYNPNWYMHAINPASGAEKPGFPVKIGGYPSNDKNVPFGAEHEAQRTGLLLLNGVVYAGFGSHCDAGPYRGYVVGVSTAGTQTAMWDSEVGWAGGGGGIWHSGGGLVSDGPNRIILATGNGISPSAAPGNQPPPYLSEAVVRLQVNADGSLSTADFFSPSDAHDLDSGDRDFASGGPVALPDSFGTASHPHVLLQQGKDGRIFLLDRDNLGGMDQGPGGTDAAIGVVGPYTGLWGHPAVWGGDGGYVYYVDNGAPMRAFKFGATAGGNPALSLAGASTGTFQYTSGSPVVTSQGTTSGSAVVWEVYSSGPTGTGGQLRAYNAVPDGSGVLALLNSWPIGTAVKFSTPATSGNRVYVGTRGDLASGSTQGTVMGFGRPATSVLTGASVDLGKANVGSTVSGTLTLTATKALNVTGITSAAPFSVTQPTLPKAMAAGDTLALPVTFTAAAAGSVTGIVSVATDAGTAGFGVTGTGVKAGLGANPSSVVFDTQPTASTDTTNVQVTNTGTTAETVSGSTGPSGGPYTVTGLPAVGTVIQPGASSIVSVKYAPTAAGSSTASFSITSTSGTLTVPISGTAVTGQAHLTLSPASLSFGNVPLGSTAHQAFVAANDGNIDTTLNLAKAPGGDFSVANPIPEGLVLGPGQAVTVDVAFTPSVAGAQSTQYTLTPDSGQGKMTEPITGTGVPVLPAPSTGWQANGSATFPASPAGSIQLTPAVNNQHGSAFYATPVQTNGLAASFTLQMSGGTGGDGATFALIDPSKGSASSLGAIGGGMGFSGIPGLAVIASTSWNGKLGYGNYLCIASGPGDSGQDVNCLSSVKLPAPWGTSPHTISVTVAGGSVKVSLDGTQMLNYAPAAGVLPASAYAGFTGSTGGSNNVQVISNISIAPGSGSAPPVGQALTATPTSVGFGNVDVSSTASQSVTLTNNGGVTETVTGATGPSAPFGATLPAAGVTIAPAASVTVPVTFTPTASGTATSSFVVTTTSGTLTVNVSGYGGTGGVPASLPALTDASWKANGTAVVTAGAGGAAATATLTKDGVAGSVGTVVNGTAINPIGLSATFSATLSGAGTSGADGMTFALLDSSKVGSTALGQSGGGLGVAALPATFFSLNTFGDMGVYGHSSWCAVGTATYGNANLSAVATDTALAAIRNNGPHTVVVTVTAASHMVVTVDGIQVVDAAVTLPPKVLVAFTAGDGSLTDAHAVTGPTITYAP